MGWALSMAATPKPRATPFLKATCKVTKKPHKERAPNTPGIFVGGFGGLSPRFLTLTYVPQSDQRVIVMVLRYFSLSPPSPRSEFQTVYFFLVSALLLPPRGPCPKEWLTSCPGTIAQCNRSPAHPRKWHRLRVTILAFEYLSPAQQ